MDGRRREQIKVDRAVSNGVLPRPCQFGHYWLGPDKSAAHPAIFKCRSERYEGYYMVSLGVHGMLLIKNRLAMFDTPIRALAAANRALLKRKGKWNDRTSFI